MQTAEAGGSVPDCEPCKLHCMTNPPARCAQWCSSGITILGLPVALWSGLRPDPQEGIMLVTANTLKKPYLGRSLVLGRELTCIALLIWHGIKLFPNIHSYDGRQTLLSAIIGDASFRSWWQCIQRFLLKALRLGDKWVLSLKRDMHNLVGLSLMRETERAFGGAVKCCLLGMTSPLQHELTVFRGAPTGGSSRLQCIFLQLWSWRKPWLNTVGSKQNKTTWSRGGEGLTWWNGGKEWERTQKGWAGVYLSMWSYHRI